VGGEGVATSKTFAVPPSPYPITVKANVASSATRGLGVVMLTIGSVGLLTGSLLILNNNEKSSGGGNGPGTVALLAGAGLLTGGILLIANTKTRIDFGPAPYGATQPRLVLGKGIELAAEGIRF
jgi:hypothetical protein